VIPKVIHLCWLSGDPFPPLIQSCRDSWARHLPDYRVRLWDAAAATALPAWVHEAIAHRKYAFAADFIRLYALYAEGGVYLDADVEVTRPLDAFLGERSFMGRETGGDLEPAVIGAERGIAWIAACLAYYHDRHFVDESGRLDQRPLPMVIEQVLRQRFAIDLAPIDTVHRFQELDLTIFPADRFSPKCRFTGKVLQTSETVTIHHFDGKWVDATLVQSGKVTVHRLLIRMLGHQRYVDAKAIIRRLKCI
jgi:hypothetical protein